MEYDITHILNFQKINDVVFLEVKKGQYLCIKNSIEKRLGCINNITCLVFKEKNNFFGNIFSLIKNEVDARSMNQYLCLLSGICHKTNLKYKYKIIKLKKCKKEIVESFLVARAIIEG